MHTIPSEANKMWLESYLKKHPLVQKFNEGKSDFAHLSVNQEALLAIGSVLSSDKPLFILKDNETQAQNLVDEIRSLNQNLKVIYYNHEESLRVEAIVQSEIMKADRLLSLKAMIDGDFDVCITHAIASTRKISKKSVLEESILKINTLDQIEDDELVNRLLQMGYSRVKYVDKPFTFSVRGGIVDVYSVQMDYPVRIEFFDVEVDSIRSFDPDTQRSIATLDRVELIFASDVLLQNDEKENLKIAIDNALKQEKNQDLIHEVEMKRDLLLDDLYDGSQYPLLSFWNSYHTIFDYIGDARIVISPFESVEAVLAQNELDVHEFLEEQVSMNEMIYVEHAYADFKTITQGKTIQKTHEYESANDLYIPWHAAEIVSENVLSTLAYLKKEAIDHRVIIALTPHTLEEFKRILNAHNVDYSLMDSLPKANGIYIDTMAVSKGFMLSDEKIIVYTEFELYHYKRKVSRYDNKFSKAETLGNLQDLEIQDYVVHRQYGIGKYLGIETRSIEGTLKDFMRIEYRDGDELFIPLEQFSLVRKYLSSHAAAVRLSKLGSGAWEKSKARIKADVEDVADRLVTLYASRSQTRGFAFSPDTAYQKQFEDEFPYELTLDQKTAVEDIKKDMESDLPMDRLLCGDVGFGKTEVAIRAAFKAFSDHKQVIFLCPTTILSQQHYRTLVERFKDYPVNVAVLNRFVSPSKQKLIIKDLKEGKVDILIGTHRVLSKDIKMKDMGLLIIDEEQRFGVEHKERIKEFKVSVDVLSLSATPIPRTLQMSLVGLRSLSQLNTPPSNRLPIMTYVIEKHAKTIHDIISKELRREGQVFYLYNNVEQLYSVATGIDMHVAGAKVGVVHGQMDRDEIEDVMIKFIAKELNVLVCTTIIETGIDIPNANTIIVDNAHRFGLSQLYQIKGRVGRSSRLAYAYFVVPSKRQLTEIAQKRLQAIKEFTQLGSGYKIAMRDLTIRGAGELLGGNQSGFIDSVGMDLYVELLKEAIAQRKGEVVVEPDIQEQALNLKIDAYLPQDFTSDDGESLDLYQQIDAIEDLYDLRMFNEMIKDRYGKLPHAVEMLLEKVRLELFLKDDNVLSFKERMNGVELVFTQEFSNNVDGIHLFELVSSRSSAIEIKYVNQTIILKMPLYPEWAEDLIYILENIKEQNHET